MGFKEKLNLPSPANVPPDLKKKWGAVYGQYVTGFTTTAADVNRHHSHQAPLQNQSTTKSIDLCTTQLDTQLDSLSAKNKGGFGVQFLFKCHSTLEPICSFATNSDAMHLFNLKRASHRQFYSLN